MTRSRPTARKLPARVVRNGTVEHLPEIRGAARLACDAVLELTSIVEAMHARIASVPGVTASEHTSGITGLVYRSVRGVTRLAAGGVDGALALLATQLAAARSSDSGSGAAQARRPPWREREALLSALNGVVGDHLAATANPLALPMTMCRDGRALTLDRAVLQAQWPQASGRLVVLLHGLCMNDLQWQRDGHDHGAALAAAGGYTPVYLRYNTGLPVQVNAADLAGLMMQLVAAWPQPIERLVLLAHSMGGLVARSALHQGTAAGQSWPALVDDVVFLGTPHHGAPLERVGHGLDIVLGAAPYAAPLARLGRLRSAGITDLRHGRVSVDGQALPLPQGPRFHAVAASLGSTAGRLKSSWVGDGLVPVDSALGAHSDAARHLAFEEGRQAVLMDVNHMSLLNSPQVWALLKRWLC